MFFSALSKVVIEADVRTLLEKLAAGETEVDWGGLGKFTIGVDTVESDPPCTIFYLSDSVLGTPEQGNPFGLQKIVIGGETYVADPEHYGVEVPLGILRDERNGGEMTFILEDREEQ